MVCDKPVGASSRDVVNVVDGVVNRGRRRKQRVKVGHTGTLDPLASGVLVVAIGPATRLSFLIGGMAKRYDGTFRLNQSTPSGDLDGEVTHHDWPIPTADQLSAAARTQMGHIEQTPPAHSAIHIDGVKAYKRVRAGEDVTMPPRRVRVDSIAITRFDDDEFDIDVVCGGGTYMRTLGMDIAAAAGNVAVMTRLVRTAVGLMTIDEAIDLETIKGGGWADRVLPLSAAAVGLTRIDLDQPQSRLIDNGCPLAVDRVAGLDANPTESIAAFDRDGNLRAIMNRRGGLLRCTRVFAVPGADGGQSRA